MVASLRKLKIAAAVTHPIQYYSPWFATVAKHCDLQVFYSLRQSPQGQADAGFGTAFDWDVPLLDGYQYEFLKNVSATPGLSRFGGTDTPSIFRRIAEGNFDAVMTIGWHRKSLLQAAFASIQKRVPLFVRLDSHLETPRSLIKTITKWPVYSAILPNVADYLSPGLKTDAYLANYLVPRRRTHRLVHAIDTERFAKDASIARNSAAVSSLRTRFGFTQDDFVFLFCGKLISKKRPNLILDALRELNSRAPTKVKLVIVGDGPMRDSLAAAADNSSVAFAGFQNQSQLPAYYAMSDCLVLPSNGEETWGLVVNEAQACGIPAIVSSEVGCAPDLIEDGVTGWTMRIPNKETLLHCMVQAIGQARKLPRLALAKMAASHSFDQSAKQLIHAVQSKVH